MSVQPSRTYSVEEANAALPEVRRLVEMIVLRIESLPELQESARVAEYRAARPGAGAADATAADDARRAIQAAELDLAGAVTRLERMGVALKDPRLGLVDFYGYRDGELVELCWKLGEDTVANWHRIGEGFAGRKPV
jgi:hypothetical protein